MKKNLDITKPNYSGHILPVLFPFVISRFHCMWPVALSIFGRLDCVFYPRSILPKNCRPFGNLLSKLKRLTDILRKFKGSNFESMAGRVGVNCKTYTKLT